jgi:hypothetical protein
LPLHLPLLFFQAQKRAEKSEKEQSKINPSFAC